MKNTAYFCMEFGIDQMLKNYAGGLGYLAGSHFRSAYNLNLPLVGVSMLWSYGYYDQIRDKEGQMNVHFVRKYYEFLEDIDLKVSVNIYGSTVWVKVYKLNSDIFETCPIYFLTTDIPENDYLSRTISHKLYDGNNLTHIAQEIVLGVAGYKVMQKCENIDIYHINEAQSLPLGFKMIEEYGLDYVKNHLVFTTHTPVSAGNEVHDINLLNKMGFFSGVDITVAKKLGGAPFNLTVAALRMSKKANAVSKLHNETTNNMWDFIKDKCEITYITNAQDKNYWQDPIIRNAAKNYDYDKLRDRKRELKELLFEEVADQTGKILDPDIMTVVWARRFTEYKRPYLLLYDEDKLKKLLDDKKLQVIWAGKPHPNDTNSQITFNWIISKTRNLKGTAILTGYELKLSKMLKQGSDVWLNTPKRPNEASGTSGMSASMNASIHLSTLDGWHAEWAEMYPDNSYTIGDCKNIHDAYEANCMYNHFEIMSNIYDTEEWWNKACNCVNDIVKYFDSERMVKEYAEKMYV
ncbi:alpha-glucan family phosphorylase [Methanococcus aeolicus]|uniref:alpha-glucan family phosphorylase n=1 Tax=Methanococcus aeolicus TaxID=42879 RepID=UPI0021C809E4|nr:alpha-glucan family phosphorylase [Methanococcus aeolicus]UXM84563.1 alpha-glucan family phosphorylase [Methanococcus aeolicus]